MPPLVSILIPLYNRERCIGSAIASALAQTYAPLEIIVCDDGSTDRSREEALKAIGTDRRATVHAFAHRGINATLASAHELASGELVGWLDSDDLLHPQAVKKCVAVLQAKPGAGLVYTHHQVIDYAQRVLGVGQRCSIPYSPQRLLVDFMTFHFRLFRKSVFEAVGGINTQMALAQDYDFCLRMSEAAEIVCLPEVLYSYRAASDSVSNTRRLEQIEASADAVRRALARRGLSERAELHVDIIARFTIQKKGGEKKAEA